MRRSVDGKRFRGSGPPIAAAALALLATAASAQPVGPAPDQPAISVLEGLAPLSEVLRLETPPINAAFSRAASTSEAPFRFAEPFEVQVTPTGDGRWEATADGKTAVWRLRVVSPGAVSINLGFTRYRMPPDGSLRVYTPDGSEAIRPFTDADNEDHGELWTPIVSGEEAVIEVAVPAARIGELELELGSVNRGFRQISTLQQVDQSCMVDVACSSADPYRDQVRSIVVVVTGGHSLCSGVLLQQHGAGRQALHHYL